MAVELFALREVVERMNNRFGHNIQLSCLGACDQKPSCLSFLQKNHQPKHLIRDMHSRWLVPSSETHKVNTLMASGSVLH